MRGRKPVPTHLKVIRGNPGKRVLNANEPRPLGDLADPPEWMSESQKAGWNYAIEHSPAGLLKKLDRSVLSVWVVAEDLHRRASEQVDKFGILTKAPNTGLPIQSPYLPVVNKQAAIMLKAAEQLGFTPASRSRIQLMDSFTGDADDEWDWIDRMRHADGA
jgi:P27 family predicted phage terminase small subunit